MNIGGVVIGGGAPVAIQSMCSTATEDVAATVAQILRLEQAGCQIIRVAVPTMEAARRHRCHQKGHPYPAGGGYPL